MLLTARKEVNLVGFRFQKMLPLGVGNVTRGTLIKTNDG